ncbi:MAG: hypothetical protein GX903_11885 [Spirochaetales bacterium]|nr:hypothetical protein [Spirochaetales bacterium]
MDFKEFKKMERRASRTSFVYVGTLIILLLIDLLTPIHKTIDAKEVEYKTEKAENLSNYINLKTYSFSNLYLPTNVINETEVESQSAAIEPNEEKIVIDNNDNEIETTTVIEPSKKYKSLGVFKITGYCACKKCCGKTNGITASGTHVTANRTIGVDPKQIPYGTKIKIGDSDIEYVAEDCGGGDNTNHIDIYFNTHQDALMWGVKYLEVFIIEK